MFMGSSFPVLEAGKSSRMDQRPLKNGEALGSVFAAGNRADLKGDADQQRDSHAGDEAAKPDRPLAERKARDHQDSGAQIRAFPEAPTVRRRR
jgi:hypothetical protein